MGPIGPISAPDFLLDLAHRFLRVIAPGHPGIDDRDIDQLLPQELALMRAVNVLA